MGRIVEPGDPEWLPGDVDAVLAWQRFSDGACSGCGHQLYETTDFEFEGAFEAETVVCHACAAKDILAKDRKKQIDGGRDIAYLPEGRREHIQSLKEKANRGD